jgi:acetylornithine/succinyldiaminopimelate/putrescine aminotransferase
VLASAKGLGGGFPVGAMMAKEEYVALKPGNHGSTFGGNPLAMAAVKAVLGVVNTPEFLEEVRFKGAILKNALEVIANRLGRGAEVRGEGLLLGLDLGDSELAKAVFEYCLKEGVLVNLIGSTIRVAPPLTVSRTEVRAALDTFRGCVDALTTAVEADTAAVA